MATLYPFNPEIVMTRFKDLSFFNICSICCNRWLVRFYNYKVYMF